MMQPTNRIAKPLHQRFDELDRVVFSAFCNSFNTVNWIIKTPNNDDFCGIDLQATGTTKNGRKTKTYDIELKSRVTLNNFNLAKDCFFEPNKWLSLVEYDNYYKIYFVIYPNCNKIAIWNVTGDLLGHSQKDIKEMNGNTAKGFEKVEKQVYRLAMSDAKVFDFDLTEFKPKYNALYQEITRKEKVSL